VVGHGTARAGRKQRHPHPLRSSCAVGYAFHALVLGTVGTAIDLATGLDTVTDHSTVAVGAARRHSMNGTLKAVEGHGSVALADTESLVVIVTAHIASSHRTLRSFRHKPIRA
jgi:hypothetical protein